MGFARAARAVRGSAARVNARLSAKWSANIVVLLRGVARAARTARIARGARAARALCPYMAVPRFLVIQRGHFTYY